MTRFYYVFVYIYIYIYIERERERDLVFGNVEGKATTIDL